MTSSYNTYAYVKQEREQWRLSATDVIIIFSLLFVQYLNEYHIIRIKTVITFCVKEKGKHGSHYFLYEIKYLSSLMRKTIKGTNN